MSKYQHVLLAVDVIEESGSLLEQATELLGESAQLSVVHYVEPIPYPDYYTGNLLEEIQSQALDDSNRALHDLLGKYGVEEARCSVEIKVGRAAQAIPKYAESNGCDLIVLGSHGKHGLRLLMGSTATAVLHHAKCDVLAVRIKE